jgi:hypothetical protein
MKYLALAGLLVAVGVHAQGFQDEPTCYSWSGGHKSAGSFTKCTPELLAAKKPPPPVAVAQQAAVPAQLPPIMMPACENITPVPTPKGKAKPRPRHKPVLAAKPKC